MLTMNAPSGRSTLIWALVALLLLSSLGSVAAQTPVASPEATPVGLGALAGNQWIAYQFDGAIQLIRSDGSEARQLTVGVAGTEQYHPSWSPDGTQIAFSADEEDGTRDIWIVTIDGLSPKKVVDCVDPCLALDDPAWSPDGTQLAYAEFADANGMTDGSIKVVDLSTGATSIAFDAEPGDTPWVPRWSPDGTRLVFEVQRWQEPEVTSETVAGGAVLVVDLTAPEADPVVLADFETFAGYPDWHPTEDLIVFQMTTPASPDGPFDLYTIGADGTGITQLTALAGSGFQAIQPSWAPDGTSVVFVLDEMWSNPRLGIVLADGTLVDPDPGIQAVNLTHPRLAPQP